jgi:hypothetical protein
VRLPRPRADSHARRAAVALFPAARSDAAAILPSPTPQSWRKWRRETVVDCISGLNIDHSFVMNSSKFMMARATSVQAATFLNVASTEPAIFAASSSFDSRRFFWAS